MSKPAKKQHTASLSGVVSFSFATEDVIKHYTKFILEQKLKQWYKKEGWSGNVLLARHSHATELIIFNVYQNGKAIMKLPFLSYDLSPFNNQVSAIHENQDIYLCDVSQQSCKKVYEGSDLRECLRLHNGNILLRQSAHLILLDKNWKGIRIKRYTTVVDVIQLSDGTIAALEASGTMMYSVSIWDCTLKTLLMKIPTEISYNIKQVGPSTICTYSGKSTDFINLQNRTHKLYDSAHSVYQLKDGSVFASNSNIDTRIYKSDSNYVIPFRQDAFKKHSVQEVKDGVIMYHSDGIVLYDVMKKSLVLKRQLQDEPREILQWIL